MARNVTDLDAPELERFVQIAQEYLKDRHATPERVDELNHIFPAWLLANSVQMNRLRELGFLREDLYALRHKIAADQRHHAKR